MKTPFSIHLVLNVGSSQVWAIMNKVAVAILGKGFFFKKNFHVLCEWNGWVIEKVYVKC